MAKKETRTTEAGYCPLYGYTETCPRVEHLKAELDKHRWIPVSERLPENKNRVIVRYVNGFNKQRITIAEYIAPKTVLSEDWLDDDCPLEFADSCYDEVKDCYWAPDGFYESMYEVETNMFIDDRVTHWKPIILPEALKGE